MTISSTTPFIAYAGNGATTDFSIPFEFFDANDLQVRLYPDYANDKLTYTTLLPGEFSVTGGNGASGSVSLGTPPSGTETVTIQLSMPLTQPVDYQKHGTFPAEAHEQALDRLCLQIKQLSYRLDEAEISGGGGGNVLSFNGRTGSVVPELADYSAYFSLLGHTHAWSTITGKPTTFTPSSHTHTWTEITGKPSTFTPTAHSHSWGEITAKPGVFPPDTHLHVEADITDLDKYTQAEVDALIAGVESPNLTLGDLVDVYAPTPTDGQVVTWVAAAGQYRPVDPGSVGVAGVASFNGRSGSVISIAGDYSAFYKDIAYVPTWSEITSKPTTFAPSAHTHVIADVTGLQTALDGKAATSHTHDYTTDITGKPTEFPPEAHSHVIGDVTGLQAALDAKAPLDSPAFTTTATLDGAALATQTYVQGEVHKAIRTITTDTAHTLQLTDSGKTIKMTPTTADRALTVPPNSSVAFPIGTRINVGNWDATYATIVTAGAGVTIRSKDSLVNVSGLYAGATLEKIGTDEWWLVGDIS